MEDTANKNCWSIVGSIESEPKSQVLDLTRVLHTTGSHFARKRDSALRWRSMTFSSQTLRLCRRGDGPGALHVPKNSHRIGE